MTRVAIVLGAGGITGAAWLLGALEALHDHTGWDPRRADVVSGTSAGAIAAAALSGGVAVESLLELAEQPELLAAKSELATGRRPRGRSLPAWPGSLLLGMGGLIAADPRHRATSLVGFAPRGSKPNDEIRGLLHESVRGGWPREPRLLINACDYRTGRRVTFGAPGAPPASLADAVTASAAVPSWYAPVRIGGREYVDGGLASFTNADVVASESPDVVLCMAPFSSVEVGGVADACMWGALRRAMHLRLRSEARALRENGADVAVLEPTGEDLRVMGLNVMERRHSRAVVETARNTTAARLADVLEGIELPTKRSVPGPLLRAA